MMRRSVWIGAVALVTVWLAAAGPRTAAAAEPSVKASIDELRHEIRVLQQMVDRLDRRLSEMEESLPGPCPEGVRSTPPSAGGAPEAPPVHREAVTSLSPPPSTGSGRGQAEGSSGPSLRERWRRIERGMSAQEIEALLGKPEGKFTVAGKSVWYYRYPDNRRGTVTFSADMQVAGWQKPPFGGF